MARVRRAFGVRRRSFRLQEEFRRIVTELVLFRSLARSLTDSLCLHFNQHRLTRLLESTFGRHLGLGEEKSFASFWKTFASRRSGRCFWKTFLLWGQMNSDLAKFYVILSFFRQSRDDGIWPTPARFFLSLLPFRVTVRRNDCACVWWLATNIGHFTHMTAI